MSFNCNNSFTYALHVITLDVTKRRGVRVGEKARGDTSGLSHIPSKKQNKKE